MSFGTTAVTLLSVHSPLTTSTQIGVGPAVQTSGPGSVSDYLAGMTWDDTDAILYLPFIPAMLLVDNTNGSGDMVVKCPGGAPVTVTQGTLAAIASNGRNCVSMGAPLSAAGIPVGDPSVLNQVYVNSSTHVLTVSQGS